MMPKKNMPRAIKANVLVKSGMRSPEILSLIKKIIIEKDNDLITSLVDTINSKTGRTACSGIYLAKVSFKVRPIKDL